MRNTMRVLTLVMALAMLLTLAVSVSAVAGIPAGIYGRFAMCTPVEQRDCR